MTDTPETNDPNRVQAELSSLAKLGEHSHSIRVPIYQRLYVWEGDTIRTLLDDIHNACAAHASNYYIGALLVRRDNAENPALEVIDGQQRLTTLWLVGLVCSLAREKPDWSSLWSFITTHGAKPSRLRFAIRENIDDWCNQAIQERRIPDLPEPEEDDRQQGDLVRFQESIRVIRGWFEDRFATAAQEDRKNFEDFLAKNVQFLLTTLPGTINAVRMFEAVNDRSVQLEQHEILKARLLHYLPRDGKKASLGAAWDDCAQMGRYIEYYRRSPHALSDQSEESTESRHLWHLLPDQAPDAAEIGTDSGQEPGKTQQRGPEVESIVSFPMLLLHALRIWIVQRDGEQAEDLRVFQERELLQLFHESGPTAERWVDNDTEATEESSTRVREFIHLLCELRWVFDAWVIKWVWGDRSWGLRLRTLEDIEHAEPKRREEERKAERPLSMIQAHLYHTQPARQHLWLTPWLAYLHRRCVVEGSGVSSCRVGALDPAELEKALQTLDDYLFCTPAGSENAGTKVKSFEATRAILGPTAETAPAVPTPGRIDCSPLSRPYPEIPHYWFYKIDLILWLQWWQTEKGETAWSWVHEALPSASEEALPSASEQVKEAFRHYRFTSRHSVEHVHPQTPVLDERKWLPKDLDRLGNLGLVSGGWNSEDSNKEFPQKKENFNARLQHGHGLLSPKLALIYTWGGDPRSEAEPSEWDPAKAEAHEEFVVETVKQWFKNFYPE